MFLRKYWLPLSVFLVAIVGIGLYLLATQPPKEPIVIYKPVEPIEKPTQQPKAEAPVGDTSQGGHVHADGTWHKGPHDAPVVSEVPAEVNTSEATTAVDLSQPAMALTYHAELLRSDPIEALRQQAKERGHWSARWIPPFPPDDHEASALARTYYHIVYYRSTGETDTPKAAQHRSEAISLEDTLMDKGVGPRRSDLLKLSWAILNAGDIGDPYYAPSHFPLPGMTYIAPLGIYQYIPAEYVHLFKE